MFHAKDSCEIPADSAVHPFYREGFRRYSGIEVLPNEAIWHVDLGQRSFWLRYLFTDIPSLINHIERENFKDIRISLQPPSHNAREYAITRVIEILQGRAPTGETVYVCRLMNQASYISALSCEDESELSDVRTIWHANLHATNRGKGKAAKPF